MVEAASGALAGYIGARFGLSAQGLVTAAYAWVLLLVFFIDLERKLVLNGLVLPGTALALGLSPLLPGIGVERSALGAAAAFGLLLAVYIAARGGLGAGDVKLGAFLGAACGFPLVMANLVLSFVAAGVAAAMLLVFRIKGRRDVMPLGPYLAGGALAVLLWGDHIVRLWALRL